MKKITILFSLLVATAGFSQVVLEDFEGATPATELADGFGSATVVADPDNAAENALQLITDDAGNPWQGAKLIMQNNKIDMTTPDKTMTVDVYSLTPRDFLFKLSNGDVGGIDPPQESKTAASHGGSGWETLMLDFNIAADTGQPGYNPPNDQFSSIIFFPLFDIGTDAWCAGCGQNDALATTTYVDNITGIAGGSAGGPTCTDGIQNGDETGVDCGGSCPNACPTAPTVAAPTPVNRAPQNVISIFSDAYTDIGVDTFDAGFCGGTTTEVLIDGNPTKLITGLGCEGIEFITNRFDATGFDFFHMDIWTDTPTLDRSFNFKFSNWGGLSGETNALEYSMTNASTPVNLPNPNPGTWISIDLQLSDFNGIITPPNGTTATDVTDFVQFVISSDLGTVYYDNLYLHNNNLSTEEFSTTNFKVFPNPTANVWKVESNTIISSIAVYDILGKQVSTLTPNESNVEINATTLKAGIYFAKIEGETGTKTIKLIRE